MNKPSEQIDAALNVSEAADQPLSHKQQEARLREFLGDEHCACEAIGGRKVFVYTNDEGRKTVLLHLSVTYLGGDGQHPIFKKRVQLPHWFKTFCDFIAENGLDYDVRFLGVYHYEGLVLFVDFLKDTYLSKEMHNSSAHVYTNDLAQGLRLGLFHKEDQYGNHLYVIRNRCLRDYLNGKLQVDNTLFTLFARFNTRFTFGKWLVAADVIREMQAAGWPKWREAEWAGFFLEYRFDKFTKEEQVTDRMRYISQKKKGRLDFDIVFEGEEEFYGDLKASDIGKHETPANDQENVLKCINLYGKLWYIIYEHETRKDCDCRYEQTVARNRFIRSIDPKYRKDDMSYHERMKNSVNFVKMSILEINRINCNKLLKAFNQGHQQDGTARSPKFVIRKKDMDNFVVFRYRTEGQE